MPDEGQSTQDNHVGLMLYITPEAHRRLEELVETTGCDMGEIISKAMALFDVAVEATTEGNSLAIVDEEGTIKTSIVGTRSEDMETPFDAE